MKALHEMLSLLVLTLYIQQSENPYQKWQLPTFFSISPAALAAQYQHELQIFLVPQVLPANAQTAD